MIARLSLAVLAGATTFAATALAQPYGDRPYRPGSRFVGCIAYEDINFGGAQLPLREGRARFVGQGWNDRISSIACAPGCRMAAYEDINFGGARQTFAGNVGFVGQYWNDRISSVDIRCR